MVEGTIEKRFVTLTGSLADRRVAWTGELADSHQQVHPHRQGGLDRLGVSNEAARLEGQQAQVVVL
jgi:hypothetical protein